METGGYVFRWEALPGKSEADKLEQKALRTVGLCTMGWSMHVTVVRDQEQIALLAPRATMASVSTFHAAAGTDDASWENIMLPRGAREPPPVPRGPPLRYYLTTVSADDTSSVFDWSS
eukprot:jgi/Tetstr1/424266/TSEL_014835.t1